MCLRENAVAPAQRRCCFKTPKTGSKPALRRAEGDRDLRAHVAHKNPSLPARFAIAGGSSRIGRRRLRVNAGLTVGGDGANWEAWRFSGRRVAPRRMKPEAPGIFPTLIPQVERDTSLDNYQITE